MSDPIDRWIRDLRTVTRWEWVQLAVSFGSLALTGAYRVAVVGLLWLIWQRVGG